LYRNSALLFRVSLPTGLPVGVRQSDRAVGVVAAIAHLGQSRMGKDVDILAIVGAEILIPGLVIAGVAKLDSEGIIVGADGVLPAALARQTVLSNLVHDPLRVRVIIDPEGRDVEGFGNLGSVLVYPAGAHVAGSVFKLHHPTQPFWPGNVPDP
tara:strand:+ start:896 stop:1357 length:462 start_codon:yes stop_codon:yes gene_type:complete